MNTQKTVEEIITLWKKEKAIYVKRSSMSAYSLLLKNHIIPAFGNNIAIEESEVQAFVNQKLEQGISQKTIKDMLIVLKMVLKFGVKNNWLSKYQFDIQFPTDHTKQGIEVLSKTQQRKMMQHIEQHFTFRNLGVYLCLCTGMRIGEVCALTWDDIDVENGTIHIRRTLQRIYSLHDAGNKTEVIIDTPKTKNSTREVPMNRDLIKMLKPIKKIVNGAFFVLTNELKPTEPRTYRVYYQKMIFDLGLPKIKFHGLRHSFATRCIESKCDYKTVSVLLGHSNISTTLNLYVHPNLEQKKKAIDQMFKGLK